MQHGPVSDFKMDGLQPRIDLRPDIKVLIYPEDEVDADPHFNEYPPHEEFVEGSDWVPSQIPPKIRSPEYGGSSSDTSIDTQASRVIQAVSVTAGLEQLDEVVASTSTRGDTRKVELTPLLGLTHQFATQLEWEIQKQVEEPQTCPRGPPEVCQMHNATDFFRGCPGFPHSVLSEGSGSTSDRSGITKTGQTNTTSGTAGGAEKGGRSAVLLGQPICWN